MSLNLTTLNNYEIIKNLEGETTLILHFLKIETPSFFSEQIEEQILELGYNYKANIGPIVFDINATPIKRGCSLSCSFSYCATLPCARCLENVLVKGDTSFTVQIKQKSPNNLISEEIDVKDEEIDEIFLDEDYFETKNLVTEQLILLLPEKVLCNENCKGICPICGANRNLTQCNCETTVDPRWAPLSKCLNKQKE